MGLLVMILTYVAAYQWGVWVDEVGSTSHPKADLFFIIFALGTIILLIPLTEILPKFISKSSTKKN